jgi:hypothetical protein
VIARRVPLGSAGLCHGRRVILFALSLKSVLMRLEIHQPPLNDCAFHVGIIGQRKICGRDRLLLASFGYPRFGLDYLGLAATRCENANVSSINKSRCFFQSLITKTLFRWTLTIKP